jgi:uncharacterized protein (TIGR00106 family)
MYLMEFSITPMGKGESVGQYVAQSLEIIDRSGLDYQLHAMGTTVEGELEPLLNLLQQCFESLEKESDRITCTAKFDYRRQAEGRLAKKVASVEEKVGRTLRK